LWWKRRDPTPETPPPAVARVCVIASTAAVGGAVRRNRAKRRLREIFRRHQQVVPAGCDLMLIARAAVTDRPMPELAAKFTDACGQIPPPVSPLSA
jgi:ribonuclease P protein component